MAKKTSNTSSTTPPSEESTQSFAVDDILDDELSNMLEGMKESELSDDPALDSVEVVGGDHAEDPVVTFNEESTGEHTLPPEDDDAMVIDAGDSEEEMLLETEEPAPLPDTGGDIFDEPVVEAPPVVEARRPPPTPAAVMAVGKPVDKAARLTPAAVEAVAAPAKAAPAEKAAPAKAAVAEKAARPPADERPATGDPLLDDNADFRKEVQRLARARDWTRLAELTSQAIERSAWASLPETRAALLIDLAKVYRDRLDDAPKAEATFRRLGEVDPANSEAIDYLSAAYRERNEWRPLYDLYAAAIEPSWDPELRLSWTREMVAIATQHLASPDLAIAAWEKLWKLGDAVEETVNALSEVYRRARRWDGLASFLAQRAAQLTGAARVVALREVAEAYLSGLRDQERASEVIGKILDERPDDLVALLARARMLARTQSWDELAELGARPLEGLPAAAVLDFRRLVADALWTGGELERAVTAFERVLELDPDDADATRARDEYLRKAGKNDVLVNLMSQRAERATDDTTRADLLSRAARIAEKELDDPRLAISLWERRAKIEAGRIEAFQALEKLYETLADLGGVARALEGQLALTRQPQARVELLRRYSDHAAHRMGDDARAEQCWKEILALVPGDQPTQEELIALHRRRGDFEALDRALQQRAWRASSDGEVLALWRSAAQNCDDNIADSRRAIAAWQRVVDLAPADGDALAALVKHYRSLGKPRDLVVALESELRVATDPDRRTALCLEVAKLWEGEKQSAAAVAAYERVLRWNPGEPTALAALERLRTGADRGVAIGAIEVAAASRTGAERVELLRRALADGGDAMGRFHGLRRLLWLAQGGESVLAEVTASAAAASAWPALAALHEELAGQALDAAVRVRHQRELAKIAEEKLQNPVRALLALEACGRAPIDDAQVTAALERLCKSTNRHEDALALADVTARAGSSDEVRRAALRRRLELCEGPLADGERAFHEAARLLFLDPGDRQALADAQRLAEKHDLWRQLDALYAELWDLAANTAARLTIVRARHAIRAERLRDVSGALDQLLVMYRLAPDEPGLLDRVLEAAEAEKGWDRVLPLVEARARAAGESSLPDDLVRVAKLHEEKRKDADRAFELYLEALLLRPSDLALHEPLERLAASTSRWEHLAAGYRLAAARSTDTARQLDLSHRITAIFADKIGRAQDALDVHRRILQLQPGALASLDVLIDRHRAASEWRELRDRLQQAAERSPSTDDARPALALRWLEVGRLSQGKLGDSESALAAFAKVLEIDPTQQEAVDGVRSLTEGRIDPQLELRRLRIELDRVTGERRVEVMLAMARLQLIDLEDRGGASSTLRALVAETGAAGPGYAPLASLLEGGKEWGALVDLMEARAAALPDPGARLEAFREATKVCDEKLGASAIERRERLYRHVLTERPDDAETRRLLLALYRDGGRHEDVIKLLRDALAVDKGRPKYPGSDEARRAIEDELARVLDRGVNRLDEAEAVLAARAGVGESDALLAIASIRRRKGDFAAYLDLRQKQAKGLPPAMASLVLCHLAEACDETEGQQGKVASLYREARTLDGTNPSATEALKAIGRRAKGWRASAALLPEEGEQKLTWAQRADHLRQRGQDATDINEARGWYERAVAVEPDAFAAWDGLAVLHTRGGDAAAVLEARRSSLAAFERATSPDAARLAEHAERIQLLAVAHRLAGDVEGGAQLALRAHRLVPELASAALAVADQRLASDDTHGAFALYNRVLEQRSARLTDAERLHATFQRGALFARLGDPERAIADLREALRIDALHAGALQALADVLASRGRVAAAIQHYIQALLVVEDGRRRGELYARLGRLWEDHFQRLDEGGVCYDLAAAAGADDRDLMVRALRHYRRSGQSERALAVIERLLPSTQAPSEQAMLWTERGGILTNTDEQLAIEAFDMALSYDPGNRDALAGLSTILERRGDWEQLVQIHEARTESGTPEERAEALRSLARIATTQLHDNVRAERYLVSASQLAPTRADFEQLIALYGDDAKHAEGRRAALGGLLGLGGPYMARLIELGRLLITAGERRWAWCLLSPLMSATITDQALKSQVLELRKEFEKSDHTIAVNPNLHKEVRHSDLDEKVLAVLAELDGLVTLGAASAEELGATGVSRLDERTAVGKAFAALAARLGVEGVHLLRVQEMPQPYVVLDGEQAQVAVKAELLQLLSQPETGFLFASLTELARPGVRLLASLPAADRGELVPALYAAIGLGEASTPVSTFLSGKIREGVPAETRERWANELKGHRAPDGEKLWLGALETARRVGFVAAADLRFVARVLTRFDETLPKMPTVGKIEDLESFFDHATPVHQLIGFATSPRFAKLLVAADAPK